MANQIRSQREKYLKTFITRFACSRSLLSPSTTFRTSCVHWRAPGWYGERGFGISVHATLDLLSRRTEQLWGFGVVYSTRRASPRSLSPPRYPCSIQASPELVLSYYRNTRASWNAWSCVIVLWEFLEHSRLGSKFLMFLAICQSPRSRCLIEQSSKVPHSLMRRWKQKCQFPARLIRAPGKLDETGRSFNSDVIAHRDRE